MREKILAVVEELKRRKAAGETTVLVDANTIEGLRNAVGANVSSDISNERTALPAPSVSRVPATAQTTEPARSAPVVQQAEGSMPYAEPKPRVVKKPAVKTTQPEGFESKPLPPPPEFTIPEGDKRTRWEWLRNRVVTCPVCNANLNPGKHVVFGNGNIDSPIFFCGEAPGADEEEQGIPFVGKAGQLLVKIIGAMGLKREDVYIGNIMNWRPQTGSAVGNRPPSEEEMAFCLPYLRAQLEVVQPKVIVALGNTALKGLLGPHTQGITSSRGKWFEFNGIALMPTYHPSYVLRYGTPLTKRQIWEDMLAVMEKTGMPISDKQRGYFMPVSQ
jgi:uracil-DNA glycosylase